MISKVKKNHNFSKKFRKILPWLDIFALFVWGILLLKYRLTGQLRLLIHPNYFELVSVTGVLLLILTILRILELLNSFNKTTDSSSDNNLGHITLFPPGISTGLLLIVAITGLIINPRVLTSQIALQRGVRESLPLTESLPESFQISNAPLDRTLIDWVRTINAYPEPDAYNNQEARIQGFVLHLPQLPDNYFVIARFVIACCAVDATPIGIPVKIESSRSEYPPDTWLEIEGKMITETLADLSQNTRNTNVNKRQLVLEASSLKIIPTPKDPYDY